MEMITQTHPDMERRQHHRTDADDNAIDVETPSKDPVDLYDMLGYRDAASAVSTQQWLAMRCLSF